LSRRLPTLTLFPYTTLFRSYGLTPRGDGVLAGAEMARSLDKSMGHKVAVLFGNFEAAGSAMPDEESQLQARNLLRRNLAQIARRSEEHTSELQSRRDLVCRL